MDAGGGGGEFGALGSCTERENFFCVWSKIFVNGVAIIKRLSAVI